MSPGWCTQNEITLCWKNDACAHSSYGSTTPVATASGRRRPAGSAGTTSAAARGRSSCPLLQRRVRVDVVRLPERARVGRHRPAADARPSLRTTHGITTTTAATSTAPEASSVRRESPRAHEQVRDDDERQRVEPHVAEDREPEHGAERQRAPPAEPLRRPQRQEHRRRREQVVEDLAVHVHVVPDEVRMQRDGEPGDQPDRRRRASAARSARRRASSRPRRRSARARRPPSGGRRSSRAGSGTSRRAAACTPTDGPG